MRSGPLGVSSTGDPDAETGQAPPDAGSADARRAMVVGLEAELDDVELGLERCRKSTIVARILAIGGAALLAFALLRTDGTALVTGIAAALGGIVLGGSTRTTRAQLFDRMAALDARRADLIDELVDT